MPVVTSGVSLQDVKQHLNVHDAAHDAELSRHLQVAVTRLAHEVGPLESRTVVEEHDGGRSVLLLRTMPVLSLTSVVYEDGTSVDVAGLRLDRRTGAVRWRRLTTGWFLAGPGEVTVTYTAGHDPLPEDLQQGVLELVRHLWQAQRGGSVGARDRLLPTGGDQLAAGTGMAFPDLPWDVERLIEPYRLGPVVA